MYDHIGRSAQDIDAGVRFYAAALAPIGHAPCARDATGAGFGPPGAPASWPRRGERKAGAAARLAFAAPDRAAVDRSHAAGSEAGGRDHGRPCPRPDYGPAGYAAFLLDPDGNDVAAVCTK